MTAIPKVSVCLPTYNRARYLSEAIKGILAQDFQDFELLIADNASPDDTEDVVRGFSDRRIIYHRHSTNIGAMKNGYFLLAHARGQYVTAPHDDDIMGPNHLATAVSVLNNNPTVGFVHCNYVRIDADGAEIGPAIKAEGHDNDFVMSGHDYFIRLFSQYNFVCTPTVVGRRECHDRLGLPDKRLPCTNDYELSMRWSLHYDVGYIAAPQYRYRVHPGNDYANYRGKLVDLQQHYLARKYVLDRFPSLIPGRHRLLKKAARQGAEGALMMANHLAMDKRRWEAMRFAAFAFRLRPAALLSRYTARLVVRMIFGEASIASFKTLFRAQHKND